MALHFFKAAGGAGSIADDAGGTGAAIFDDVTFNGTTGESRDQGLFVRNDDATKQYENILITILDLDPTLDTVNFKLATTQAGLGGAAPGGSLSLPNIVAVGETPLFIRCTINAGTPVANYAGIKIVISAKELAV